jgi:hypothetical protein
MSYQHLSEAVGICKPSIHYHFSAKQDLLEASSSTTTPTSSDWWTAGCDSLRGFCGFLADSPENPDYS